MTSHDAKINLPTLRDADHYDDWKYKVVAFLVTLRLYQPIAEGRAPRATDRHRSRCSMSARV